MSSAGTSASGGWKVANSAALRARRYGGTEREPDERPKRAPAPEPPPEPTAVPTEQPEKPKRGAYRKPREGRERLLIRNVPASVVVEVEHWAERDHRSRNAELIAALEEWLSERRQREERQP